MVCRCDDAVHPRWFIGENVAGLTHHRGGCKGGRCTDDCARLYLEQTILRQLGERFAWVGWRILDAARYGVPQNRERLFLVAGPSPIEWPRETHAPPEELRAVGLFGDGRKPWRTVREALNLGGFIVRESGVGAEREPRSVDEPAYTMRVQHNGGGCGVSVIEDPKHPHARMGDPAPTFLLSDQYGDGSAHSPWYPADRPSRVVSHDPQRVTRAASRPELLDRPSPTVTAVGECKGSGDGGNPEKMQRAPDALRLGAGIRRLTPAECAILQDYPSDHPWRGTKTSIYAQIGNSVVQTLAKALCEAVAKADLPPRLDPPASDLPAARQLRGDDAPMVAALDGDDARFADEVAGEVDADAACAAQGQRDGGEAGDRAGVGGVGAGEAVGHRGGVTG